MICDACGEDAGTLTPIDGFVHEYRVCEACLEEMEGELEAREDVDG